MGEASRIGIDPAKRRSRVHGARADGGAAFRRKLSPEKLLAVLDGQRRCVVTMEACATARDRPRVWAEP